MNEDERLYQLSRDQAALSANLINAQHDITNIATIHRDDYKKIEDLCEKLDSRVTELSTDLRIYKALAGLLGSAILGLAWVISNLTNLKDLLH